MTVPTLEPLATGVGHTSPARHHPTRWRLHRAGITNVWHYFDTELIAAGGRIVLRGTNGAGKSRALEMLLPFLLDADRRRMDATGSGKVRLEELMRAGSDEQPNRLGYLWLELIGRDDPEPNDSSGKQRRYLTLGALIRYSRSSHEAKAWYFTTPRRVGHDLTLVGPDREPLSRDRLAATIGAERIIDSAEAHRDRVRETVFGLTGDTGRERYAGLLQLLHTLRSPDVGNRIEEGRLPQILSDALPPLSESALSSAGEQLDGLSETRAAQQRLETACAKVTAFLDTYRRYASGLLVDTAEQAQAAASEARQQARHATDAREQHLRLEVELAAASERRGTLEHQERELVAKTTGIKGSREYVAARDLDERERRVAALAKVADHTLRAAAHAREAEAVETAAADERAEEVEEAAALAGRDAEAARRALSAAGMYGALPETVRARVEPAPVRTVPARTARDADLSSVSRPAPATVTVTPADPVPAIEALRRNGQAAAYRARHASSRLERAKALAEQYATVQRADERAAEATERADAATAAAENAVTTREDAAKALVASWQDWLAAERTGQLLSDADWTYTPVPALLAERDQLAEPDPELLAGLDAAADRAASPARRRHAAVLATLEHEERADGVERADLEAERDTVAAAVDPLPTAPEWVTQAPADAAPMWRSVDFADVLSASERAGLEAALVASGLLAATLTPDARVLATDGQLLLTASGPSATRSLTAALVVDPAAPLPGEAVRAVLERIALGDRTHPTWVDTDGSWGNGPLTGRHTMPTARHIGAAARTAARAARLEEIGAALAALAERATARQDQRATARAEGEALDAYLLTAPRSRAAALAADRAADAAHDARNERDAARAAAERARQLRSDWTTALGAHRDACANFDLPTETDALAAARERADAASTAAERAAESLDQLTRRLERHEVALARVADAREHRGNAEQSAEAEYGAWHCEHAELAAIRESLGAAAERVTAELNAAEAEMASCGAELAALRSREGELRRRAGAAEEAANHAATEATEAGDRLAGTGRVLTDRFALPGLAAAALVDPDADPPLLAVDDPTPAAVDAAARAVRAAVERDEQPADENALNRAQQALERELAGAFDVLATKTDGAWLVELADATGRRPLATAANELARRRAGGRAALTDREQQIFTEFVLGGIADELRRRLRQASGLVTEMNSSLAAIRTSHGIGVKLRWTLAESADPALSRVRDLITTAGAVRSAAHTAELTSLLNSRVAEAFAADPTAGYAAHLRTALDYRAWHQVEVIITGPEPGRERRISRRAKLSQGETRFVSYVTLFAAVDAYLSGLPDTGRALRLLLLDDAFAKVDDPTIGELLGLLVHLDLDFVMTAHALWGCYPQVPELDCYEVHRGEGTAAVTTRVHWDGHARHLRAAR